MKAFKLLNLIIKCGLDNSVMTTYKHENSDSLKDTFGDDYVTHGMSLPLGKEMLAVWSEKDGSPRFLGIADFTLISRNNEDDRIYLYNIE